MILSIRFHTARHEHNMQKKLVSGVWHVRVIICCMAARLVAARLSLGFRRGFRRTDGATVTAQDQEPLGRSGEFDTELYEL